MTLTIVFLVLCFGVPYLLTSFWLQIALQAVIYSAVTLGLGLLVGRVGMFSLCQMVFVVSGAWISLRIEQQWSMPFPVLLVITGVFTGVLGSIIGIPALRLSGLYLALITLMAAGAITLLLKVYKFPNGGSGFWGFDPNKPSGSAALPRPSIAVGDIAYFRYSLVVVALVFLLVTWHIKGKPGRAWASIRQSQVTAVSAGVHTTLYKLWAFALSACITGVAGALLAAGTGWRQRQPVPGRGVDHPAGGRLDGRGVQRLGRRGGGVPAAHPAPSARAGDRAVGGGAHDVVRVGRDPGAPHDARRNRRRPGSTRRCDQTKTQPIAPTAAEAPS